MTIKHTKKDIGSESQDVVVGISKTNGTVNNDTKNYSSDLIIKLKKQDQYNEQGESDDYPGRDLTSYTSTATADKITVPLSDLVRQEHLNNNYYTKAQVDAQVKPHYEVLSSINNLPTAAQIRQAGHQNYIYLVPFEDATSGDIEYYEEYMYIIEGTNTATEKVERVGSTKIDLSQYATIQDLATLYVETSKIADDLNTNDSTYVLSAKQGKVLSSNKADSTHTHGFIQNDGTLVGGSCDASGILVTNAQKKITTTTSLSSSKIVIGNNYSSIGSTTNDSMDDVLTDINSCINTINTTINSLSNYLLKSEIYSEIWGTNANGFNAMQIAESNNSASKNYKLGDYIYDKVYTKTDIDTLIGTLAQLQQQTLNIL